MSLLGLVLHPFETVNLLTAITRVITFACYGSEGDTLAPTLLLEISSASSIMVDYYAVKLA
jgi:hypothetical protein